MYKIESNFSFGFGDDGCRCVVIFNENYTRCGYVGVPKTNKLFGKDYDLIENNIEVYNGISYSSHLEDDNYPIANSELWWFGFDCNNVMDGMDLESAKEYFPENIKEIESFKNRERAKFSFKTKEFVEEECVKLANQLIKLGK